ncbi:N-methyl-L-tryptophan oxidase [Alkalihalobacillus sp. MEB130]|uniref:N-methyl-L-tryptophan oxidase n=1 Tax=Alkalihalobacillus sp. MEB130 TaxID=2976704 RepID=UPI0028DE4DF8|nr:N-methyl-L-tryptophan oxidase [Alkalihalobacillus sp. MEB130]MDT8861152.1 N-methyl-L-tryptophan oxidase [Alkalihalobacillus sp. MEB130]
MNYDVIVIGAGSMGMAAGYFLSKSGKNTLLLDSFQPPHNKGSHHGETRIIRYAYGEGEEYVPFVLKAKELWKELEQTTGKHLFLQTGVLNVGHKDSAFIQNIISSSKTYSLPIEVMNATQVQDKWSGFSMFEHDLACFEPTSGVIKCEESIKAYQELAESHGATIQTNSRVKSISILNDKVTIKTDDQTYNADALVISAGAWSGELLSMLELDLPLAPVRKTFAWFDANKDIYHSDQFPAYAFDTPNGMYYGFPSIDGAGIKVGRHDGGEQINPNKPLVGFGEVAADEDDLAQFLSAYLPEVGQLKYGRTCMYTLTPDERFIIDRHPNYPNVAIASGFSGHGFKFSSAVGQALSNLIVSGKNDIDLSPFSIKRFSK